MLDVFNTATPQKNNVQYFYKNSTWVKPRGVSHVYMMLIGGGGSYDSYNGAGGPSGAVTVWYGAAQHVPDNLVLNVSTGDNVPTTVNYRGSNGLNELLRSNAGKGGSSPTLAAAMTANTFTATGFFNSVGGVYGTQGNVTPSQFTFLTGGGIGNISYNAITQYGYTLQTGTTARNGFFITQPIIVGVGAMGTGKPGIGCGAGVSGNYGGEGLIIIAAW